ncbi:MULTISPECIES: phosphatase PAP2 family protein [unclassified Streptomyces]|uniref:phosphatase PAP2 family protein n=1 Tax=unclassified Streptomyces TaxID=2593676 RepID=UPI0020303B52|nr:MULTISPECIES: phosphatase PAP2 family protein [unclassified Streptomyces]MCM1966829.1 phosphatase PAP2 family protein [Streptomyces sp. G1]MCX5128769.1 phosphatase PAP2 family protein [Streptomyces sp. NBC_00347]MCX5299306.1 phosphatase PAP2 family protein [Streptomyces sp. NBC_00193]
MRTDQILPRLERVFARLDREPERPAHLQTPRMSRHRVVLLGATLGIYLAIVIAVLTTSWLVRLDWQIMFFRPYEQWPQLHAFLDYLVVLGQRGPTAVMVAAWLGWRSWRQHTLRPLITLGVALLLLNITVGAVKLGLGRLGPHYATEIGSAELFAGGDIFPSGHTANAVVTWGILAYLASTVVTRRVLSLVSAVVSLSVGATTVYLGTHWVSDVLLGWLAGLLVLLALPWFEPAIAMAEAYVFDLRARLRSLVEAGQVPEGLTGLLVPLLSAGGKWQLERAAAEPSERQPAQPAQPVVVLRQPGTAEAAQVPVPASAPAPAPASASASASVQTAGHQPAARPAAHLSGRPHLIRSERTPGAPAGSRRPAHAERAPARGAAPRPATGG